MPGPLRLAERQHQHGQYNNDNNNKKNNNNNNKNKNNFRLLVAVRYFLDRPGYGLHNSAVRL
jgi:hypothetical protein